MRNFLELIPRYIKGQKGRTVLTVLGLALAVALISGTSILGASMSASYLDYVTQTNGSWHASFRDLDSTQVSIIASHAHVKRAGIIQDLGVARMEEKGLAIVAAEYDDTAMELYSFDLIEGNYPQKTGEIALEQWILADLGLDSSLNQQVMLSFGPEPEKIFTLTGILANQSMSQLNGYARAVVVGDWPGSYQVITEFKDQFIDPGTAEAIQTQLELEQDQVTVNGSLFLALSDTSQRTLYILLGIVILLVTVAAIHNVFHISVLERIQQYGMLRGLGTGPRQIKRIVLGEGLLLGLVAIPLGLSVSILGIRGLIALLSSALAEEITQMRIPIWALLWASAICLTATLISAWRPARLASRVSPMDAMRGTAPALREKDVPVRKWHNLLGKVFGVNGIIAWRNLQRHQRQFNVTVFSLAICVVLVIVFGFYVTAAQPELVLRSEFPAEYVLSMRGINQTVGYTDENLSVIQGLEGVTDVFTTRERTANLTMAAHKITGEFRTYFEGKLNGSIPQTGQFITGTGLYSYSGNILSQADRYLSAGGIDPDRMAAESEILIVNTIRAGEIPVSTLEVGETISLRTSWYEGNEVKFGPEQEFRIGGILSNYPFPMDMVVIGLGVVMHEDTYEEFTGSSVYRRIYVQTAESADKAGIYGTLRDIANDTSQGRLISYQDQVREMEEQKRQFSVLLFSLIGVVVVISLFSIVNTISTNLLLRTREFGVLRAVGMTRKQLVSTLKVEGFYYGLVSAVWGAAAGNLLTWIIYVAARNQATWLEWFLPWQVTLLACAGGILASLLATIGPIRRLSGMDVIDVIRRVY